MESFIMDNTIITTYSNGVRIRRINWYEKETGLSTNNLIKIETGTRMGDNILIGKLADGTIKPEDIINSWKNGKLKSLL